MVQTRSQQSRQKEMEPQAARPSGSSKQVGKKSSRKSEGHPPRKRSVEKAEIADVKESGQSPKRRRQSKDGRKAVGHEPVRTSGLKGIANKVLDKYGDTPLKDLVDKDWPESQVVMAHILNAMLSSAPISHAIAQSSLRALLDAKYNDLEVLHNSSWEERTKVLTEGGYVRYRERMANFLGDLMELMKEKYDDDASQLLPKDEENDAARTDLAADLRDIKGLGPLGVDVCMGSIQSYFPKVAPFLDHRSLETAKTIGMGEDVEAMFKAVGSDPDAMAKLEVGLTRVRFEKKEGEFAPVGA